MQLNGFDNFISKFPGVALNNFTEEESKKYKVWGIVLALLTLTQFSVLALIVGLIFFLVKKGSSQYVKYIFNQQLWLTITVIASGLVSFLSPILGIVVMIWTLALVALAVYGHLVNKNFDLPLVGKAKIVKY